MAKVVGVYGEGKPKKHSVKVGALECKEGDIPASDMGEVYVPRAILKALGATDSSKIRITFELEP